MANIVKQVSIFDTISATRSNVGYSEPTSDQNWLYTAANYDGTVPIYFEAVLSVNSGGTAYAALYTDAGVVVTGSEVSTLNTTFTRLRSGDISANLVDGTRYHMRIRSSVTTTYTATLTGGRIVIPQSGTITKTETCYAFGANFATSSATYTDDTVKTYYFYDADQFDGTVAVYFEAKISHQTAGNTCSAQLATAAGVAVTGSEITTTSAADVMIRSGDISANLADGTTYKVQLKSSSGNARARQARLVFVQSGAPTKTESYYQTNMAFRNANNTGSPFQAPVYWDNDAWGATTKTVMHEAWIDAPSADTSSVDLNDGTNDDDTRSTTSTVLVRDRSESLTLDDNTDYDNQARNSDASNGSFFGAYIIVQATFAAVSARVSRLALIGVG